MSQQKVEQVYSILTAKRIRREWPDKPEKIKKKILYWLDKKEPLTLTTTWLGAKTAGSGKADEVDRAALMFLKKNVIDELKKIEISSKIKILFADSNASYLEGYDEERIELYYNSLKKIIVGIAQGELELISLNQEFWGNFFKLNGREELSIEEIVRKKKASHLLSEVKNKTEQISKKNYFKILLGLAEKHSLLVKNKILTKKECVTKYLEFRILAFLIYTEKHPHDFYFTYVMPEYHRLLTSIPTFYFYSLHKGTSECPWFTDKNSQRYKELKEKGKIIL